MLLQNTYLVKTVSYIESVITDLVSLEFDRMMDFNSGTRLLRVKIYYIKVYNAILMLFQVALFCK